MRLFYRTSYRVFWVLLKLYGASHCRLGNYYYFAKHFPPQTPSSHTQACFRREKRAAGVNPFSDFKVSPFAAPPPPSPFTPSWGRKGKEEGALQKGRILELLRSEVQIVHIDDREGGGPRPDFRTQEDLVGLRERGRGPPAWGVTDGSGPIIFIVPLCQGRNPSPLAGGEGLGDQIRLNAQGGSQGLPPWWRPFGAPPGELVRGRDPWRRGNSSFST